MVPSIVNIPLLHRLLLAAAVAGCVFTVSAQNSVSRRTVQSPGPRGYFLPTNSVPLKPPAPVTSSSLIDPKAARATTIVMLPPEKPLTDEEKAKREQKKLEFHRSQAEAGRDFAQYEMGMRYLKGDGVGQNREEALRWLKLAADQNYTLAVRKLAELDAPAK